jgi:hypothetical protein
MARKIVQNQRVKQSVVVKVHVGDKKRKQKRRRARRGGGGANSFNPAGGGYQYTPVYIQSGNPPPPPEPAGNGLAAAINDLHAGIQRNHREVLQNALLRNVGVPVAEAVPEAPHVPEAPAAEPEERIPSLTAKKFFLPSSSSDTSSVSSSSFHPSDVYNPEAPNILHYNSRLNHPIRKVSYQPTDESPNVEMEDVYGGYARSPYRGGENISIPTPKRKGSFMKPYSPYQNDHEFYAIGLGDDGDDEHSAAEPVILGSGNMKPAAEVAAAGGGSTRKPKGKPKDDRPRGANGRLLDKNGNERPYKKKGGK